MIMKESKDSENKAVFGFFFYTISVIIMLSGVKVRICFELTRKWLSDCMIRPAWSTKWCE